MHWILANLLLLGTLFATPGEEGAPPCNGFAELCNRAYDDVAYACSHNAMSSAEMGFVLPNHKTRMRAQLASGIRALMLDVHMDDGLPMLCHGPCSLGAQDIVAGLAEIGAFMRANPREVVTLLIEPSGVVAEVIANAFEQSGVLPLCLRPRWYEPGKPVAPGNRWPTLGEMISSGERLVVLTSGGTGPYPWLLPMWQVMWDTPYSKQHVEEFGCAHGRGNTDSDLFNMNHFITRLAPLPNAAAEANQPKLIYERARRCWEKWRQIPNFITVDYQEIGGVMEAVNLLNGVTAPPTKN